MVSNIQMERIDLKTNSLLKTKFIQVSKRTSNCWWW